MSEQKFDDIKSKIAKKSEIWSTEQESNKEFKNSDTQVKQKLNAKGIDYKHEHYLINQYKVKPDPFKKLIRTTVFKIPCWLISLLSILGFLALIGTIAAILAAFLIPKKYVLYNEKCSTTIICDPNKSLICTNEVCVCSNANLFWNTTSSFCEYKKTYSQYCSSITDCFDSEGLTCSTTSLNCNCPATSINNMCDCVSTQYFDMSLRKCVNKLTYGSSCTFTNQCLQTIQLVCSTSTGKCSCPENKYYTGSSCDYVKNFGEVCSSSSLSCNSTKGLVCSCSGSTCTCKCASTYYYNTNSGICELAKAYDQACTYSTDCYSGLTCTSGKCACPSSQIWSLSRSICVSCSTTNYNSYQNTGCYKLTSTNNWNNGLTDCNNDPGGRFCILSSNAELNNFQNYLASLSVTYKIWVWAFVDNNGNYKWQDGTLIPSSSLCNIPGTSGACIAILYYNNKYCFDRFSCTNTERYCCQKY